jgi:hypothetical protein
MSNSDVFKTIITSSTTNISNTIDLITEKHKKRVSQVEFMLMYMHPVMHALGMSFELRVEGEDTQFRQKLLDEIIQEIFRQVEGNLPVRVMLTAPLMTEH